MGRCRAAGGCLSHLVIACQAESPLQHCNTHASLFPCCMGWALCKAWRMAPTGPSVWRTPVLACERGQPRQISPLNKRDSNTCVSQVHSQKEVLTHMFTQVHRQKRLRELEGDMAEGASAPGVDEDAEREAWLAQMHLAALRSHDMLDLLQQVRLCRRLGSLLSCRSNLLPG